MAINQKTDNIVCDICGADCGYYNHNGDSGYDLKGIWRDICEECGTKHSISSCICCQDIHRADLLDDNLECEKCRKKEVLYA